MAQATVNMSRSTVTRSGVAYDCFKIGSSDSGSGTARLPGRLVRLLQLAVSEAHRLKPVPPTAFAALGAEAFRPASPYRFQSISWRPSSDRVAQTRLSVRPKR